MSGRDKTPTNSAIDFAPLVRGLEQGRTEGLAEELREVLLRLQPGGRFSLRRHPLGFLMLKMADLGNEHSLRLHLWTPTYRTPQEPCWPIHDHVFAYSSFVIIGSIQHRVYDVVTADHGHHQVYEVSYDGEKSVLVRTEVRAQICGCDCAVHGSGTIYSFGAATFHETVVPNDAVAATLLLTKSTKGTQPRVLGEPSGVASYKYVRAVEPDIDLISSLFPSAQQGEANRAPSNSDVSADECRRARQDAEI